MILFISVQQGCTVSDFLIAIVLEGYLAFLKGGPSKNCVSWGGGVPKVLLKRGGGNLEQGEAVDIAIEGGCHFFITLKFNCIYCLWGKK